MKRPLFILFSLFYLCANAQNCNTGGCAVTDTNSTGQYPSSTFSTPYSTWSVVSQYMNGGNYTLFNVTSGHVYEWSYCSDFGGSMGWNAELTLFNNTTGTKLCYDDNCARSGCPNAPYVRWTATYTGKVRLLTTVSGCNTNTGSPYSKLVWRDTSGTPLQQILGVDVYSGQGAINWVQVKNAGYTFAYAKATEGVGYTDSQYLNYAVNGVNAGIKMGAYHFARADLNPSNQGAINEANYFLSVAQPYIVTCQMPPSLDLEGSYLTTNFTSAQLTAWVQNWMTTVQNATGIAPVLYCNPNTAAFLQGSLTPYPLWLDYVSGSSTTPPPNTGVWPTWTFNQYDWTATVPGIPGSTTDLDVYNGSTTQFNNWIGCNTTGITEENLKYLVSIYPNPALEVFNINYPQDAGVVQLDIYDVDGRRVFTREIAGPAQVDVRSLAAGVYNVHVSLLGITVNKKLIIVK